MDVEFHVEPQFDAGLDFNLELNFKFNLDFNVDLDLDVILHASTLHDSILQHWIKFYFRSIPGPSETRQRDIFLCKRAGRAIGVGLKVEDGVLSM